MNIVTSNWWLAEADKRHTSIFNLVDTLETENSHRRLATDIYLQLAMGSNVQRTYGTYRVNLESKNRIRLNICKSIAATACARIAKNKTRIQFMTDNGDQTQASRAKKLTRFMDGLYDELQTHRKMQKAFRDAVNLDLGCIHVYRDPDTDRPAMERVFPGELQFDDLEAETELPRSIHRVKNIARSKLLVDYPEFADAIEKAPLSADLSTTSGAHLDMVRVIESHHAKSSSKAKDGRHCISIQTATLVDEAYDSTKLPYVFLVWEPALVGLWGHGIVSTIAPLQLEINQLLQTITKSLRLSAPFIVAQKGACVDASKLLSNDLFRLVECAGQAPQIVIPNAVSPQIIDQLVALIRYAYELSGISELSATGKKPAGLESGIALREYSDMESERFALVAQDYETAYIDVTNLLLDVCEEIASDNGGSFKVKARTRSAVETLDWSKVSMDRDAYVIQLFPVSMLPQTPSGKLAMLSDMMDKQMITSQEAMSILQFPDLDAYTSLESASIENLRDRLERMTDPEEPEYLPPEDYHDTILGMRLAQQYYDRGQLNRMGEQQLENLRQYMIDCQAKMPQPAPPPGMATAAPEITPAPAPPSIPPQTLTGAPLEGAPTVAVPPAV